MHYIISHTHWDREWFAPYNITKKLLPGLFKRLFEIIDNNPDYKFVLDGQMLIVEDYLSNFEGNEREKIENKLKKYSKNIAFGPYYGQIDWRIAEEASIRNILVGVEKAKKYGEVMKVGWLLDNFGFSSQVPQIHIKSNIDKCFLWRGLNLIDPSIGFLWKSFEKSILKGVFLLDSYRNLMRLNDYLEIKEKRLKLEIDKLQKYNESNYLPLMNGYDLDPQPEDPTNKEIKTIFPKEFIEKYFDSEQLFSQKFVEGELMDGSVVAVFPGSLSTRQYLKIMHWYSESMLSKVLEPLAVISGYYEADKEIEKAWEYLISNLVHDSIGGVGVDQVHEDMEKRYEYIKKVFDKKLNVLLEKLNSKIPTGYVSLNLNPEENIVLLETERDQIFRFVAPAGSISKTYVEKFDIERVNKSVEKFSWENKYYQANIEEGVIELKNDEFIYLVKPTLVEDKGDEYSSAFGNDLDIKFLGIKLIAKSLRYAKVKLSFESEKIDFDLILIFSELPYIKATIQCKGKGSEYALLLKLKGEGEIISGLPFDSIKRPPVVKYDDPSQKMKKFLVAAREINFNDVFPMKDYVGLKRGEDFASLMAKGIYSYTTHDNEFNSFSISLILVRSISWLSKENVQGRIGDAGPVMYTPGAEMKRETIIETAIYFSKKDDFLRYKNSFTNSPILFYKESENSASKEISSEEIYKFYSSKDIEFVCMKPSSNRKNTIIRFFNPTDEEKELKLYQQTFKTDITENKIEAFDGKIAPKEILTLIMPPLSLKTFSNNSAGQVNLVNSNILWNISDDSSLPDIKIIEMMESEVKNLRNQINLLDEKIGMIKLEDKLGEYRLLFEKYKLLRKALELELSSKLNRSKFENVDYSEIENLVLELNNVRIKRRGIEFLLNTLEGE